MKTSGLLSAGCLLGGVLILLVKGDEMLWVGLTLITASGAPVGIAQIQESKRRKAKK